MRCQGCPFLEQNHEIYVHPLIAGMRPNANALPEAEGRVCAVERAKPMAWIKNFVQSVKGTCKKKTMRERG